MRERRGKKRQGKQQSEGRNLGQHVVKLLTDRQSCCTAQPSALRETQSLHTQPERPKTPHTTQSCVPGPNYTLK